ncbi:SurA N-terminal domain-containing protein [Candidatus Thiosymbion oneisti]|uniref:SurA N-terminal domain-containing protein n=1 Tax=Candidatus Thiosymbion oneisti TaxID=589554 RepID=UPI000ADA4114|nr:SurA N-terminal domain-containing protein [Candidatus Thiosymbion oneisti]
MLQTIRERAQGWIAWVIVIFISIPFALWGIQSYLGVGAEPVVATVNGVEITERELDDHYRGFKARLRDRLGAAYRPELFDDNAMRGQVLDQMIRDSLLMQTAEDLGLRASDRELRGSILSDPAFQKDGQFDNPTYERMLELQGMVPHQFEDELRRQIVGTQLLRAIVATEILPDRALEAAVQLDRQQRRLSFIRVPKSAFLSEEPVSDEEVTAYYESNRSRFQIPERIRIQYLVLDARSIAPPEVPGEQELREHYEAEKDRFTQPERRRVRHILIALDAGADAAQEDAAKAAIAEIRERIAGREGFAALAKELSQDPGSAAQGGDLGFIEQGLLDPALDQAAFALDPSQLSEVIRSRFGYHLIEVTGIDPGETKPFEAVKPELIADLEQRGNEGLFFESTERLANLSYESPDSLEPAAEALGLELQTSGWIDRSGGEGILAYPKVLGAAFSDEVLLEGNNSDLIEPDHDQLQAVVLRVLEHEEATAKPLDAVRDEIVTILRDKQAADVAAAKATELADALTAGGTLSVIAGDYQVEDFGLVARDAEQIPAQILDFAFTLSRPNRGSENYGSLSLNSGDGAVVILTEVVDGSLEDLDEATRDQIRKGLTRDIGRAYYENLLVDLESRADITRSSLGKVTEEE